MLLKYGDICYSIDVEKSCDNILFGCGNNFLIYNSALQYVRHGTSHFEVLSLCSSLAHNKIYYLNSGGYFVHGPLDDLEDKVPVFGTKSGSSKRIAVNDEFAVVSNVGDYALNVYRTPFKSKCFSSQWGKTVRSLKFHPDGDLLTLDWKGTVCKHSIHNNLVTLIWECHITGGAYAICADQNKGLVYVTAPNSMLFIVNTAGKWQKLQTATMLCFLKVNENSMTQRQFAGTIKPWKWLALTLSYNISES